MMNCSPTVKSLIRFMFQFSINAEIQMSCWAYSAMNLPKMFCAKLRIWMKNEKILHITKLKNDSWIELSIFQWESWDCMKYYLPEMSLMYLILHISMIQDDLWKEWAKKCWYYFPNLLLSKFKFSTVFDCAVENFQFWLISTRFLLSESKEIENRLLWLLQDWKVIITG